MASPRREFIVEAQASITEQLQVADKWSALKEEYASFAANNITIGDADVQAILPNVTAAQFLAALGAQQEVVDYIHVASRAAKLYRVKR